MTARLANKIDQTYSAPSQPHRFFGNIWENISAQQISRHDIKTPLTPCDTNLFLGLFFDGTGNNYEAALNGGAYAYSNVARLYSAFPGLSVPGVLPAETDWEDSAGDYTNYFRVYLPGVGTRFTQVDDSGEGFWDGRLGGGAGRLGQVRIVWALAQAINTINRFFTGDAFLIGHDDVHQLSAFATLSADALSANPVSRVTRATGRTEAMARGLLRWLQRLHEAIAPHMPGSGRGGEPRNTDPAIVRHVYISTFGFSRGAASARVFTNWLIRLCELDAQLTGSPGLTLGGFPVTHDFLGLFDTVAAVGLANLMVVTHGHAGWADAEVSLRIDPRAGRCLHLVSAHENRRSFPLDSIYSGSSMPANGEEIVYPGVHSDVGGGYAVGEQGKGVDAQGEDMLSRIPLAEMYRQARLSGVPFKLEQASQRVKDDFKVSPRMIEDFNNYIDRFSVVSGEAGNIMREHWRKAIEWRLDNHRRGGIELLNSYRRASQFDKNFLRSAYEEFCDEIERFESWVALESRGASGMASSLLGDLMVMGQGWILYRQVRQKGMDPSVEDDWRRIAEFLPELGISSSAVTTMMDEYVHDSLAGFLLGWESRDEVMTYLQTLVMRKRILDDRSIDMSSKRGISLSRQQREYAEYFERTGNIPEMESVRGREPTILGGGYFRFRRVYAGADDQLLTILAPEHQPGSGASRLAVNISEVGAASRVGS